MRINKNKIKNEYLKNNDINLNIVKNDLKKIKQYLKKLLNVNFPNKFQLFKNKENGFLYLTVTTINFDIVILNYSKRKTLKEQIIELFPEYIFLKKKNKAGGFNLFPGNTSSIYGFSDEKNIIIASPILEF